MIKKKAELLKVRVEEEEAKPEKVSDEKEVLDEKKVEENEKEEVMDEKEVLDVARKVEEKKKEYMID